MDIRLQFIGMISLLALMSSCSTTGGQITSFEDLSTESHKEGFFKIPQYRVISIIGILPFSTLGAVHFYKAKRKPSSAIGLSNRKKSYTSEMTIGDDCDTNTLPAIRDKIVDVKISAANLIANKVELRRVQALLNNPAASESDKQPLRTELVLATEKYDTSRSKLDDNYKDAVKSIKTNGVLIFRWDTKSEKSWVSNLGSIFGVSGASNDSHSGFGMLCGLKISSLYVGDDLLEVYDNVNVESNFANRYEITTYTMKSKQIMYMSEQDFYSSLDLNVKASYSQLANVSQTIRDLDNIEIKAAQSKVANLSNMGAVGGSRLTERDVNWNDNILPVDNVALQINSDDDWQTVFAVKSDLLDILKMMKDRKKRI